MAVRLSYSYPLVLVASNPHSDLPRFNRGIRIPPLAMAAFSSDGGGASSQEPTKLVTFLGKGGSGKTTAAIFAAQVLYISFVLTNFNTRLGLRRNFVNISFVRVSVDFLFHKFC